MSLLVAVLFSVVAVSLVAALAGAVPVHDRGIETGLGSVLVGVVAILSVSAVFMAASLLVRMAVTPMRMVALTVASAGRKREGERNGKEDGEHRRDPIAVHGAKC
jgi:hypothetical protein